MQYILEKPMLSTLEEKTVVLFMALCFIKTLMKGQKIKDLFCSSYPKFIPKTFQQYDLIARVPKCLSDCK